MHQCLFVGCLTTIVWCPLSFTEQYASESASDTNELLVTETARSQLLPLCIQKCLLSKFSADTDWIVSSSAWISDSGGHLIDIAAGTSGGDFSADQSLMLCAQSCPRRKVSLHLKNRQSENTFVLISRTEVSQNVWKDVCAYSDQSKELILSFYSSV